MVQVGRNLRQRERVIHKRIDLAEIIRQFQKTVPSGLNYKLISPGSRDPGHYHVFHPHGVVVFSTTWETRDGFTDAISGTGVVSSTVELLFLDTDTTINSVAQTYMNQLFFDYLSDFGFQASVYIGATTNQTVYFGIGDLELATASNEGGIGFKVSGATISAVVNVSDGAGTGVETTIDITSSIGTLADYHTYRAIKQENAVVFYVDDKVVATIATVPDGNIGVTGTGLNFYIKNTAGEQKTLKSWSAQMFSRPI